MLSSLRDTANKEKNKQKTSSRGYCYLQLSVNETE